MAIRRMFAKSVINSGAFLRMPESAQALYIKISLNSDDDGYSDKFFTMQLTSGKQKDLQCLVDNGFIYDFDDEVLLDLRWKENNHIRPDRKNDSKYAHLVPPTDTCRADDGQETGKRPHRLGKVRLGKDKIPSDGVCEKIISYLNEKANRKFDITNDEHHRYIRLRWKKHPDIDKFKLVIDICCAKWKDNDDMKDYLQPSTLFNGKFSERLGWSKPNSEPSLTAIQRRELLRNEQTR